MLKQRIIDLTKLHDTERALNNDNTNKANNYNIISIELQKLKDENLYLRNTLEEQSKLLTLTIGQEKQHKAKEVEYIQTIDNLKEDKAFLTKSNANYESRDKEHTRIIESRDNDIIRLEQQLIQLSHKLSNANSNINNTTATNNERVTLTNNVGATTNMEMIEAELRMLREAKISLEFERMGLQQRNDSLNQESIRLMKEISTIQRDKYENMSDVQSQLREKCFELATLGTTLEKRENIIRQLTRDLDMTKEENAMYREAIHRLETDFEARERTLLAALEETKGHLHTYEMAEEEIDRAVMKAGGEIIDGADESEVEANLRKTVDGIATSTERRIHQSLSLATKVLNLEKERDDLIIQVNETQALLKTLTDDNESHQKTIFYTGQPTSYLVAKLRDEEKEKKSISVKNKALVAMVKRLENIRDGLAIDNETLKEKMKIILSQRKEVQQLCYLLENLKDDEEEETDDDDNDDDVGDGDTDVDDGYDNNDENYDKNEDNNENTNVNDSNNLSISLESLGIDEGLREIMTSPKSDTSDKQKWYKTEAI